MKRIIPLMLIAAFLLSACGALEQTAGEIVNSDATATISPEEIRATADAMVYDMLTQTQAAMPVLPTNTLLPQPTATLAALEPTSAEPAAAAEGEASPTVALATQSAVETPTATLMPTTAPAAAGNSCMDNQFASGEWTGGSAPLSVTNNVRGTTANVFLCIQTEYDGLGWINIYAPSGSGSATVPYGCYTATAWVHDDKNTKNFNAVTTFCISQDSAVQLVIEENRQLYFKAGCAPGC